MGKPCVICEHPIPPEGSWLGGHNAQPVADGRCCRTCNYTTVIPARFRMWMKEDE